MWSRSRRALQSRLILRKWIIREVSSGGVVRMDVIIWLGVCVVVGLAVWLAAPFHQRRFDARALAAKEGNADPSLGPAKLTPRTNQSPVKKPD
jgi:hypothetical protein